MYKGKGLRETCRLLVNYGAKRDTTSTENVLRCEIICSSMTSHRTCFITETRFGGCSLKSPKAIKSDTEQRCILMELQITRINQEWESLIKGQCDMTNSERNRVWIRKWRSSN
ncbi:hypothetical protein RB195_000965 [Necator americanus]|uniref:Apple domain-containing protein n=1 Tax=Necator americanus TaxID=51031 RepID=A0ABR1DC33_NECAM